MKETLKRKDKRIHGVRVPIKTTALQKPPPCNLKETEQSEIDFSQSKMKWFKKKNHIIGPNSKQTPSSVTKWDCESSSKQLFRTEAIYMLL